jgi:hypothetical protein
VKRLLSERGRGNGSPNYREARVRRRDRNPGRRRLSRGKRIVFLASDASRAWRDFWLIESSASSSAWHMRRAVRSAADGMDPALLWIWAL